VTPTYVLKGSLKTIKWEGRDGNKKQVTKLMRLWFDAVGRLGLSRGSSFDLDFLTIPFHGEDALMEKRYLTKRSRRQKGILAFLAQDAEKRVFCYANGQLRKAEQNEEVHRFVEFGRKTTATFVRLTRMVLTQKTNMGIQASRPGKRQGSAEDCVDP
jgi:hypothetical protein